jgi:hypothetical protein
VEVAFLSPAESSMSVESSASSGFEPEPIREMSSDEFVKFPDCDFHICRCPSVGPHVHLPSVV